MIASNLNPGLQINYLKTISQFKIYETGNMQKL